MAREQVQTELVEALFEGVLETPRWTTFLDRLRKATGADYAILISRPPGWAFEDALHLLSGDAPSKIREVYRERFYPLDPMAIPDMVEGRPYSLAELFGVDAEAAPETFRQFVLAEGLSAIRQMRIQEATGVNAWLTIARRGEDFGPQEDELLTALGPQLRGVLRLFIAMERERFAASLTAEAVRRLQFGWLTLDRAANVLECDEQGGLLLSRSGVLGRTAGGRLRATPPQLEREIHQAVAHMAAHPQARPRAITLSRDPWLDMLLAPARGKSFSAKPAPAVIAYVHGDSWRSTDRCEQLAELFGLSPREARLALALSRGMTLAEAAAEFGLAVGSARTYSKAIYAKTGARGLPDLVRIVMRSVLAIAPEV